MQEVPVQDIDQLWAILQDRLIHTKRDNRYRETVELMKYLDLE